MISAKMQEMLNKQISVEMYSAYLYLSMSGYCETIVYKGFARWLRVQYQEEVAHALKMLDYLLERGGQPALQSIAAPPHQFEGLQGVFDAVVAHEQQVTERIRGLYEAAIQEKDHAMQVFLQWFIAEQVEEEATVAEIAQKLRMIGDKPATLLYLDKEYGKRSSA
jgi:ferritin